MSSISTQAFRETEPDVFHGMCHNLAWKHQEGVAPGQLG